MANPTFTSLVTQVWDNNAATYTWTALAQNSAGLSIQGPGWTDRGVQIIGTFGGATVTWQISNDGLNWSTAHDPFSNPMSFTGAAYAAVTEISLFSRPNVSGGDSTTSITVIATVCNHSRN